MSFGKGNDVVYKNYFPIRKACRFNFGKGEGMKRVACAALWLYQSNRIGVGVNESSYRK